MIVSFRGYSASEIREKVTAYHNKINSKSMDWVICSCTMVNVNGVIEALVVFNSKLLGDV